MDTWSVKRRPGSSERRTFQEVARTVSGLPIWGIVPVDARLHNRHGRITIAAAITSKFEEPLYLTEVLIAAPEGGLVMDSVALLN